MSFRYYIFLCATVCPLGLAHADECLTSSKNIEIAAPGSYNLFNGGQICVADVTATQSLCAPAGSEIKSVEWKELTKTNVLGSDQKKTDAGSQCVSETLTAHSLDHHQVAGLGFLCGPMSLFKQITIVACKKNND